MKYKILSIFALFALSACNTTNGMSDDLSSAWNNVTNLSSNSALKDYTDIIEKHSTEPWANYSYKTVEACHIKKGGMDKQELIERIKENPESAKDCWKHLVNYPSTDVRFYKEGSIEKEVFAEFEEKKDYYSKLFMDK